MSPDDSSCEFLAGFSGLAAAGELAGRGGLPGGAAATAGGATACAGAAASPDPMTTFFGAGLLEPPHPIIVIVDQINTVSHAGEGRVMKNLEVA